MAPKTSATTSARENNGPAVHNGPGESRCNDFRPCEAGRLSIRSEATAAAGNGFLRPAYDKPRPRPGPRRQQEEIHGQMAFDHRLSGTCDRPVVDRSGHRRDSLAAIELPDLQRDNEAERGRSIR